ncbi:FAD-dependent monooxygenase [Nonomuraea sp. NPDC059194]|uniref:FAD-dependent monooxygenase n=1 Tax=Nonomuraea sp. NPDC059194 TaxID=3346764 RepID=UPI0036747E71
MDVLIVGAGPTGLTLACDLARRGIDYRIIEQSPVPQVGSRGFTLKPRSLEALDDLGVADRIVAAAAVHSRIRFHLGEPPLFDLDVPPAPPSEQRPYPNALALPEWRTEAILRDRLAELGGKVDFGHRLTGFTTDAHGVTATLERADGAVETVHARYLIGADGGRSQVRRTLGLPFTGATAEDTRALLADVRIDGLDRRAGVHLWMASDGHLLVARPIPQTDTWQVVASLQPDAAGQWPDPTLATLQQAMIERTGRADLRLSNPQWLSAWRYNLRMVDTYRVGPVLLAGDAAHVHSPFGGHGMNTGIQDAYNLGWKLALVLRDVAADSLLDTYQTERLPVARAVLADSDQRFSAATHRGRSGHYCDSSSRHSWPASSAAIAPTTPATAPARCLCISPGAAAGCAPATSPPTAPSRSAPTRHGCSAYCAARISPSWPSVPSRRTFRRTSPSMSTPTRLPLSAVRLQWSTRPDNSPAPTPLVRDRL